MTLPLVITAGDPGHISDHEEIHDILSDVELADLWVVLRFLSDVLANRGAAGRSGSLFLSTNEGASGSLSLDNGSGWVELWQLMPNAIFSLLTQGSPADNLSRFHIPLCIVGKSGGQSIASAVLTTTTAVTWDDEAGANRANNEGTDLHSTATNPSRLKATRDGFWRVGSYIRFDGADADGERVAIIEKNNDTIISRTIQPGTASDNHLIVESLVELEQGDFCEIEVAQNSGSSLDVESGSFAWFHWVSDE